MRKEKKERDFSVVRKSVILRLKEKFAYADVKIMSHVLTVVLMIAIIAATVAWFVCYETVSVKGMYLRNSSATDVEVSLDRDNWIDITGTEEAKIEHDYENAVSMLDISMPAFQNIYNKEGNLVTSANSGIIAPGTYGSFSFYVKLVNNSCDACILDVSRILDSVTGEAETDEITRLVQGHILCFARIEGESACRYVGEETPIRVEFESFEEESEIKEITIYWVWPYEYKDLTADSLVINKQLSYGTAAAPANVFKLPDELPATLSLTQGNVREEGSFLAANQVFDWDRYRETVAEYSLADTAAKGKILSDWYDYADTRIGSYVKNLLFHIEVKGVQRDET